jgi:hypothetical protein
VIVGSAFEAPTLSLPVSTISQWWVSRSSSAVVILASSVELGVGHQLPRLVFKPAGFGDECKIGYEPFEFQGFYGKRLIVSFGWRYDFNGGGLQKTEDVPDFLLSAGRQLLHLPTWTHRAYSRRC